MSIPRLELPEHSAETALLARLVGSLWQEPGSESPDAIGIPAEIPEAAGSSPPAGESRHIALNGGFPSPSESAPPVHPTVVGGPHDGTPSGGAPRDSANAVPEAYEFGEPRIDVRSLPQQRIDLPVESDWTSLSKAPAFPRQPSLPSEPDFYFLEALRPVALPPVVSGGPPLSTLDVESVRRDFPALHQRVNGHPLIYLDNAATTHKPQAVLDATSQFYGKDNANIHRAAHALAERATAHFERGREKVRRFLGAADSKEIVFLRGTTEAINLVANSYGRSHLRPGDEILITNLEHHANIVPWQLLAQQSGAVLRVAPITDQGELIVEEFARLLTDRTKIVSIAHVSNALGTVTPVEQLIPLAHAAGAVVLVDGAQSAPHLPINVSALDADFFVFSAHKVFGPTGIGALYGKKHLLDAMPPWQGGGHMIQDVTFERTIYRPAPEKFEAGTPDIAGVIGLSAAIDYLTTLGIPAVAAYEHALLEHATGALLTVPGLHLVGTAPVKASVLSFVIDGVPNDTVARHLDQHGIAVRAGHHCALPAQRRLGHETTVRPSLAFYNTYAEVDTLVETLHRLPRR